MADEAILAKIRKIFTHIVLIFLF